MATQTETKQKQAAIEQAVLPRYHFLFRIVGQRGIEGSVLTGAELDAVVNDWLDEYDIVGVDYLGQYRDQSNTVLGHQFGYHLRLKESA